MENGSEFKVMIEKNPYILANEDQTKFQCSSCKTPYKSLGGISLHSVKVHNLDRFGNVKNPETKGPLTPAPGPQPGQSESTSQASTENTELDLEPREGDDQETLALKAELRRRLQAPSVEDVSPESLTNVVHTENSKDIASKAVQLVTDIDLMFLYHKTKRMFPPEYDFADWVRSCVVFTMNQFRIKVNIAQDLKGLDDSMVKYFFQVNQDWIEWDKKKLEKAMVTK